MMDYDKRGWEELESGDFSWFRPTPPPPTRWNRSSGCGSTLTWELNLVCRYMMNYGCWIFLPLPLQIMLGLAIKPNNLLSTPLFCLATYLLNPTTVLCVWAYYVIPKSPIVEFSTLYPRLAPPWSNILIVILITFNIIFLCWYFGNYCVSILIRFN